MGAGRTFVFARFSLILKGLLDANWLVQMGHRLLECLSKPQCSSSDPGPLVPGDPQSFNRYAYVQNKPHYEKD